MGISGIDAATGKPGVKYAHGGSKFLVLITGPGQDIFGQELKIFILGYGFGNPHGQCPPGWMHAEDIVIPPGYDCFGDFRISKAYQCGLSGVYDVFFCFQPALIFRNVALLHGKSQTGLLRMIDL